MIDEKKMIKEFEKWIEQKAEYTGLKQEALLEKVIEELNKEAVNEEIRNRILEGKRIYISGKMTGLDPEEISRNFALAKKELRNQGYIPISPTGIKYGNKLSWAEYMRLDEVLIQICDAIYMLSNWQDSPGACHELEYARILGKPVIYQEDLENVE